MKTQLTNEKSQELFLEALCNSLGYFCGNGLQLQYNKAEYQKSKEKLTQEGKSPCFEDVLMKILTDGGTLTAKDIEGDGDNDSTITIKDVNENVILTPEDHLQDALNENGDAITGDCILQSVFFKEVIFG
jgi:hypothetical protein